MDQLEMLFDGVKRTINYCKIGTSSFEALLGPLFSSQTER